MVLAGDIITLSQRFFKLICNATMQNEKVTNINKVQGENQNSQQPNLDNITSRGAANTIQRQTLGQAKQRAESPIYQAQTPISAKPNEASVEQQSAHDHLNRFKNAEEALGYSVSMKEIAEFYFDNANELEDISPLTQDKLKQNTTQTSFWLRGHKTLSTSEPLTSELIKETFNQSESHRAKFPPSNGWEMLSVSRTNVVFNETLQIMDKFYEHRIDQFFAPGAKGFNDAKSQFDRISKG